MILALSLNSVEIEDVINCAHEDRLCVWNRYPGCGWLSRLKDKSPYRVMTSLEASIAVGQGKIDGKEILTIQEEGYDKGLASLGATSFLNMCLESPMYTRQFYAHINAYREQFMHSMYFDWKTHGLGKTQPVYFPSYDVSELMIPEPVDGRKLMSCIMSNKWSLEIDDHCLHGMRSIALSRLIGRPGFDLYGRGWHAGALSIEVGLKTPVMRSYKFALCYENYQMEGYVTEKIIHAILAGSVPVYLGAPDIVDYVPKELFIDARTLDQTTIYEYLQGVPDTKVRAMIEAGQKWLRGAGSFFSYDSFAKRVLGLVPLP